MLHLLRNAAFAVPFGALAALATHAVRFGDDHRFGGDANEAIVTLALGGTLATALVLLHAFLQRGTTIVSGSVARVRLRALVPHPPLIFAIGAAVYYGIEGLEGNAPEFGLPTLLLALCALALGLALRRMTSFFARVVAHIVRAWLAELDARRRPLLLLDVRSRVLHPQLARSTRRFGRAPPAGR